MEFRMHPIRREIVIDGFHSIYYFEFGKDFWHPPERHDFWELVYVDAGKVNAIVDGKALTLSQGDIILHRPMAMHAHVSNRKDPNCMLVVSFTSSSCAMDFFDGKIFTTDKTAKTLLSLFISEAKRALGEIPGDYKNRDPLDFSHADEGSFQLLECYLTELLLTLRRRATDDSKAIKESESSRALTESSMIELIVAYFNENLDTPLSLADVCKQFFIGKSQLCKLFHDRLGTSPMEHYQSLRIAKAKKMLLSGECSVTGAAERLGYSSIHNFSRAFKMAVGISPREYRQKIENQSI